MAANDPQIPPSDNNPEVPTLPPTTSYLSIYPPLPLFSFPSNFTAGPSTSTSAVPPQGPPKQSVTPLSASDHKSAADDERQGQNDATLSFDNLLQQAFRKKWSSRL
ncbi:hypothetical protein PGT21_030887 [Puccinia graminis f. sp. tritici]|uniref:Uncharacterized protein n=1 Tax=Puccinia graminis f. sp. tritici TaxID=56615 RepID=A0A5B0MW36_PUCGR|nr:hypothetical protein PGT21_030887 [Puccinia graminis f. sp. tritici]KAA1131338.1 hypothetical protein PGTUg99_032072 [Puccinia graminis f. sp. tritici]